MPLFASSLTQNSAYISKSLYELLETSEGLPLPFFLSATIAPCPSRKFPLHGLGNMRGNRRSCIVMLALLHLFFALVFDRFKTRRRLESRTCICAISSISRCGKFHIGSGCAEPIGHSWSG